MGCSASCLQDTTMSLFGRSTNNSDDRIKLERKLYIAKESPEPDFDLSDCQLQKIPSGIFSICKVFRKENLYFQNNKLQSLEDGGELSDLYLMKVLNISFNQFLQLPSNIRFFVNLTELYIQGNQLTVIPENIKCLQGLTIFDISQNNLLSLTPALGSLKKLSKLNLKQNNNLCELCPELCLASSLQQIDLDYEQFIVPPSHIAKEGVRAIMQYLCDIINVDYIDSIDTDTKTVDRVTSAFDNPFQKDMVSWETEQALMKEQEHKIHKSAKRQREKFLTSLVEKQTQLDNEIARVHATRDIEKQNLVKKIQENELEIERFVINVTQCEHQNPEVIQQQLIFERKEHDRLLEIIRQNQDNVKKADILKTMESIFKEDFYMRLSRNYYGFGVSDVKKDMMLKEKELDTKLQTLLIDKDKSHTELVQQVMEDQDIQKAMVASLLEQVDTKCWSLNQEISLISSNLAKLSMIEQNKKKLHVSLNYNELLTQRTQLITILEDLFAQKSKRKQQLIDTLKDMEKETDLNTDFWLRNYQKLVDSAPKNLLNFGTHLDPVLANSLLQEGVIHCLPFMVKFLSTNDSLLNITPHLLRKNGVTFSSDREAIMRAITSYIQNKSLNNSMCMPSAPLDNGNEPSCSGTIQREGKGRREEKGLDAECVICMDEEPQVVFVPCGHMCCCLLCANKDFETCPMCRNSIEKIMKVILP